MKKSILISFFAIACLLLGNVTFASDTGIPKVPKKELVKSASITVDLNVVDVACAYSPFEVAKTNFVKSDSTATKIAKAESSNVTVGLLGSGYCRCSNDNVLYIKNKSNYLLKNYLADAKSIDVWKDKIKQCSNAEATV